MEPDASSKVSVGGFYGYVVVELPYQLLPDRRSVAHWCKTWQEAKKKALEFADSTAIYELYGRTVRTMSIQAIRSQDESDLEKDSPQT